MICLHNSNCRKSPLTGAGIGGERTRDCWGPKAASLVLVRSPHEAGCGRGLAQPRSRSHILSTGALAMLPLVLGMGASHAKYGDMYRAALRRQLGARRSG